MVSLDNLVSGASAIADGALKAGVSMVTGYPGAPITAVVDQILAQNTADEVRIEWMSNEKVAIETAFGASLGGQRALLCVKGVGLNIALDPLMALNLSGCNAGFVILVGDDPGGWGSQNEQDSRSLAMVAEIPLLEPISISQASETMLIAYQLSESIGLPIFVRVTRALVSEKAAFQESLAPKDFAIHPPSFANEFMRWVVLPINVVPRHQRLWNRLEKVRDRFETSAFNHSLGEGPNGIIAAGYSYHKLMTLFGGRVPSEISLLGLRTFFPFPSAQVTAFLQSLRSVLVIEETAPLVERAVREAGQRISLSLPVYGRDTNHLPRAGELFAPQIAEAVNRFLPQLSLSIDGETERPRPSQEPLCEGCPYIPTFSALIEVMDQLGGRDNFVVVGDPGCMVRAQLPPYKLLDIKTSLGSSIAISSGLALSLKLRSGKGGLKGRTAKKVVAICGDSGFFHSGINSLIDASRQGVRMLVLILDNGTTALSGGQPHPGSSKDARGKRQQQLDLISLVEQIGSEWIRSVNLDRHEDVHPVLEEGLAHEGLAVVIIRGDCVRWLDAN